MNLRNIHIEPSEGRAESMVLAMQAVARAEGVLLDYDHLTAALGLSLMTVAAESEPIERWPDSGRDAFLTAAAALFGLTFRDLHPPEAAVGLAGCPEFAQHFDASYAPLVLRALEHAQPVLAWMGWPEPADTQWGLVTGFDPDRTAFTGLTSAGPCPAMVGPSIQLYTLEAYEPKTPDPAELAAAFLRHSAAILADDLHVRMNLTTGPRAFDLWVDQFNLWTARPDTPENVCAAHRRHAHVLHEARASALRFLADHEIPNVDRIREVIQQQCNLLASCCTQASDPQSFETPDSRHAVIATIRQIQEAENTLAILLRP